MIRRYKAKILIAFTSLLLLLVIFGQLFSNSFIISGKISSETGQTSGASVEIFKDGEKDNSIKLNSNGKFNLHLEFNHEYTLVFSREECFSKKIVVSTIVPENILKEDPEFPEFEIEQNLFNEIKGIDKTFSENTIEKVHYNEQIDNFVSKVFYDDNQIKKQIEQAILKAEQLEKAGAKLDKQESEAYKLLRKEYDRYLAEAGEKFNTGLYPKALSDYMAANKLFPEEQFPIDRINEINDLLAALKYSEGQPQENYSSVIAKADAFYDDLLWQEAKEKYQEALLLKPNDNYSKAQIQKIEAYIADISIDSRLFDRYRQGILDGNKFKSKKQFLKAKAMYEFALSCKPGDADAIKKLEEVRMLLGGADEDKDYNKFIVDADEFFNQEEYKKSLRNYEQASAIKPTELYPLNQIAEIKAILSGEKTAAQIAKEYAEKIKDADNELKAERYQPAKGLYKEALALKSDEQYPVTKIREIDRILADLNAAKSRDEQYAALITQADSQFNEADYDASKENYVAALKLKSEEQHPQDRIIEINRLVAELEQTIASYNNAIQRADTHFGNKNYDNAQVVYKTAKEIKPDETYPDEMISRIQSILVGEAKAEADARAAEEARLLASQRQKDSAYDELIGQGDNLFGSKEYVQAIGKYRSALDFKPGEQYPIRKIEEIRGFIAQITAAQQAYDDAIARADRNYEREIYDAAKLGYAEAKAAKTNETYPDEMIAKIDSIEQARAEQLAQDAAAEAERLRLQQEQIDQAYNAAIAQADASYNTKEYQAAITSYKEALDVKPDETYPQDKVTEIESLVAELARIQKAYDAAIIRADRNYQREIYDAAKLGYAEAKAAKTNETYPDEMIAKIDSIEQARAEQLAQDAAAEAERLRLQQEQINQAYNAAIAQADASYNTKEYQAAITSYKEALDVKPDETYPQDKVTEIESLVAELARIQKAYDAAIIRADRNYQREIYDAAKLGYAEAKAAKTNETYPDEMIAKIDSIEQARAEQLAQDAAAEAERLRLQQEQIDQAYNAAIAQADASYNTKEYQAAITSYKEALDVKPDESYPQDKVTEIESLVAELARIQKAYDAAITRADRNYQREIYDAAKLGYAEAKAAKTNETYPDEMIAKIDSIEQARAEQLAQDAAAEAERLRLQQEQIDQAYNAAIAQADASYNTKEYQAAITSYKEALDVKPDETYPQDKVTEIESFVAEVARIQQAYDAAITRADRNYQREIYDAAKLGYAEAKAAKTNETYPDEMIAKIDSIEQARAEQLAQEAAEEAERLRLLEQQRNQAFNTAITQADNYFNDKDYQNAARYYKEGLDVKPEETHPKQKLDEIDQINAALLALENQYKELIREADDFFSKKAYEVSKGKYNEALRIKNTEEYPKNQLARIDQIFVSLAEAQELENRYNAAIQQGDNSYVAEKFNEAITSYESALVFKPAENYPKEQILAAKNKLTEIATENERLREIQRAYQNAIAKADQAFNAKNYGIAETSYKEAIKIKADETYPVAQLEKIKEQIARDIKTQYDLLIADADSYFNRMEYNLARGKYSNALIVVPDDTYANGRIAEVDRLVQELAEANAENKRIQQEYMQAITLGDRAYQLEQHTGALGFYNQALSLKPNETYPKIRVNELEQLIRNQKVDENYRRILLVADEYFKLKQYHDSRAEYMKALNLKPEEDYPAKQIRKIDDLLRDIERTRLIAEQQAAESIAKTAVVPSTSRETITLQGQFDNYLWNQMMNAYNGFLNQADEAFSTEEYNISRFYYHQALSVFPDEVYPKEKISEIGNIINGKLYDRLEREYQQSIDDGDAALKERNLTIARFHYNKALALKPREKYPRLQVDEIRNRLDQAQSKRSNQEYQDFINQADEAYNNGNLSVARYYYTKASYLKPNEQYPTSQLQNIERVLINVNQGSGGQNPE